jgi:hypothetical protein
VTERRSFAAAPDDWMRPLAIGVIGAALMFAVGIRQRHEHQATVTRGDAAVPVENGILPIELHVPRVSTPPKIDGELDEPEWTRAPGRTGGFVTADGAAARPFSEARLLWDEKNLYVALFAADEDVQVAKVEHDGPVWLADSFGLVLTRSDGVSRTIDVGPSGTLTDGAGKAGEAVDYTWQSNTQLATDIDGTRDDTSDRDEEWVVEMAIPLAALGLAAKSGERIGIAVKRCDQVEGKRVCGFFGGTTSPAVLVLD